MYYVIPWKNVLSYELFFSTFVFIKLNIKTVILFIYLRFTKKKKNM